MKHFIVLAAVCYAAAAAVALPPPVSQNEVPILSQESTVEHDGTYHYSYESGDGTKAQQSGQLKVFDKDSAGQVVTGSVSYPGDDGQTYSLSYTADENGYQPQGAHLPVAPPIPEQILRALEYIAQNPPKEQF